MSPPRSSTSGGNRRFIGPMRCSFVHMDGEVKGRFPVHNLAGVVCFGNVLCSPFLLGHCAQNGVAMSFLTENGRFLARVVGEASGNVLLRREQYRRAESATASAKIARNLVLGKMANPRMSPGSADPMGNPLTQWCTACWQVKPRLSSLHRDRTSGGDPDYALDT